MDLIQQFAKYGVPPEWLRYLRAKHMKRLYWTTRGLDFKEEKKKGIKQDE